jgi:lysophospholipase L1-like esterase
VKPWKIALFLLSVMSILLLLTFFSSSGALQDKSREEGLRAGKILLKYPSLGSFLGQGLAQDNTRADSVITLLATAVPGKDTAVSFPDLSRIDTANIERLRYPADRLAFISAVRDHLGSGRCRILHYGDSQIEGDRISGFLRNRLQGIYGGSGPGFIPVRQVYSQMAAEVGASDNWQNFSAFDPARRKLKLGDYGIYGSYSRFLPDNLVSIDTANEGGPPLIRASITIRPSRRSFNRLQYFDRIGLHYGNAVEPVKVIVSSSGEIVQESFLLNDGGYHCFEVQTEGTPQELSLILESTASPNVYGLTLDGSNGISLDNIAMRGESGTLFHKLDVSLFRAMAERLDPSIILFQFGGNTVPYIEDSAEVVQYTRYLAGNLKWLQRHIPAARIIVIGPTDKSTMINAEMVTYPLLPYLDERMGAMAVEQGCAYWSMFKAMGGTNAMPHWVAQGLAADDYTHFSPKGARLIGELFFTSLYLDIKQ